MFQTKVVEKIKTHILCSIIIFPKIVHFMRKCGKILHSRKGHRRLYGACALDAGYRRLQTYIKNTYLFSFPIVQSTRCTCYLKLFMTVNRSTCFGRSFHPSSGVQNCVNSNGICQTAATTCCYNSYSYTQF